MSARRADNQRFERSRGGMLLSDEPRPYGADLKVVLRRCGVVGEPRRESMIGIKQLRFMVAQPRVAQPHR
jgi:hypothetical protein